jgi:putative membrane protein
MRSTKRQGYFAHAILINSHLCGLIGMQTTLKWLFLLFTPYNLLLSTFLLFYHHTVYSRNFWIFCISIFLLGYGIEVVGVHTGLVFGDYSYGQSLGFKLAGVPLVMGLNWLNLIYSIGVVFNTIKLPIYLKALIGATTLTLLDILIEPIAIHYDYWSWESISVPIQNYLAWLVISFLFLVFFYSMKFKKDNRMAVLFFIVQVFFFATLNIVS